MSLQDREKLEMAYRSSGLEPAARNCRNCYHCSPCSLGPEFDTCGRIGGMSCRTAVQRGPCRIDLRFWTRATWIQVLARSTPEPVVFFGGTILFILGFSAVVALFSLAMSYVARYSTG